MIPVRITIEKTGLLAGATVRQHREVMKGAHQEQAAYWHKVYLPMHFGPRARARYGYRPRSRAGRIRKDKMKRLGRAIGGANDDLIFTGLAQSAATAFAAIRGYPTRGTVDMRLPSYFRTNYKPGRPNLNKELLVVTGSEQKTLATLLSRSVTKRYNAIKTRTVKTV